MCKKFLAQLRRVYPDLQAAGVQVIAMTQGQPDQTRAFCQAQDTPFVCLSDPDRASYRAFGLSEGLPHLATSSARPTNLVSFAREMLKGNLPGLAPRGQSLSQLSGAFVIDQSGTVRYARRAQFAADLPTDEELLTAVRALHTRA